MGRKKPATNAVQLTDQAVALAEFAAKALVAAEQIGIKKKPVEGFPLDHAERLIVAEFPGLSSTIKKKLAKKTASFTIADTASFVMALSDSLLEGEPLKRLNLLLVAKKLIDCLEQSVVKPNLPAKAKKPNPLTKTIYQFKITLLESQPSIWRRIQVQDCMLDKLHEHIQTAMGWTNSHLHRFKVGDQAYADPDLMEEDFEEFGYKDSTTTKISKLLPKDGKRFRFQYEYDFGDSWYHEVLFEGVVQAEPKAKYPLCLEGARACPPEDCGGIWGYPDFLDAIQNPEHERHEELLEWIGGQFDPEEFDPAKATKAMRKGLPDWRSMAGW